MGGRDRSRGLWLTPWPELKWIFFGVLSSGCLFVAHPGYHWEAENITLFNISLVINNIFRIFSITTFLFDEISIFSLHILIEHGRFSGIWYKYVLDSQFEIYNFDALYRLNLRSCNEVPSKLNDQLDVLYHKILKFRGGGLVQVSIETWRNSLYFNRILNVKFKKNYYSKKYN